MTGLGDLQAVLMALHLLVLHRSDGGEVWVNADLVTSLRDPVGELRKLAPPGACIIGLSDGKFVAVIEPCKSVKRQLDELLERP